MFTRCIRYIPQVALVLAVTTTLMTVTGAGLDHRPSLAPVTMGARVAATKTSVSDVVTITVGWGINAKQQVLRTTTGGQSWTVVSPAHPNATLLDTSFTSSHHAVVVGAAHHRGQWIVWATTNAGHTWHTTFLPMPKDGQSSGATVQVSWYSTQRGWLMLPVNMLNKPAQDRLYRTTNGGMTWQLMSGNLPYRDNAGVVFSSSEVGWLPLHTDSIGPNHPILATTVNGGTTWQAVTLPHPPLLAPRSPNPKEDYSPHPVGFPVFATSQLGALLTTYGALNPNGTLKPKYPVVYFTTDGGSHWQWIVLPVESETPANSPTPSTLSWQSTPHGWVLNVRAFTQKIIAQWSVSK